MHSSEPIVFRHLSSLWNVLFWYGAQNDNLRLSDVLAQMMSNLFHSSVAHFFALEPVMSFACESAKNNMKVCVCTCCMMWKAHRGTFNGVVEQLCPITFLSKIVRLKQSVNLSELQEVLKLRRCFSVVSVSVRVFRSGTSICSFLL